MGLLKRAGLYYRTIKNLKPVQIIYQIKNRLVHPKVQHYLLTVSPEPVKMYVADLDGEEQYLKRFHIAALMNNEIDLLHEKHRLDGWHVPYASHLWNYNLQYLEFTVPLAVWYKNTGNLKYRNKWMEVIASWLENASKCRCAPDTYAPYTISMRIPNILIGMQLTEPDADLEKKIYSSVFDQYRHLQKNMELGLLANHYLENLKTLVICSVLFGERDQYRLYFSLFLKQIDEQILSDGLHFERSLMYHKIILEDVIRVYTVLKNAGKTMDAEKLLSVIQIMSEAMGSIERGFDRTPLFNDAGDNVSKRRDALLHISEKLAGKLNCEKTEFEAAGYYRLEDKKSGITVLFDCGNPGPDCMGGHAHNDCLSFELSVSGQAVLSNSGTGQYQGTLRHFFRSAAAHNTIMTDRKEQSELWGEHRIGRRLQIIAADTGLLPGAAAGAFRSCQGDRYRRSLKLEGRKLKITDQAASNGFHTARQFFHLVPGYRYERADFGVRVKNKDGELVLKIIIPDSSEILIHTKGEITNYAKEFGLFEHKEVLEIRTRFENRIRINLTIDIGEKF